jgi:L-fuconate dehydratase
MAADDVLGHAAIWRALKEHGIGLATGEHAHNRMVLKQFLQAEAIDVCQIDSCCPAGVSEVPSVLFMATESWLVLFKFGGANGVCNIWRTSLPICRWCGAL